MTSPWTRPTVGIAWPGFSGASVVSTDSRDDLLQPHAMHFRGKGRRLEAEQGGCTVRTIDSSTGPGERFEDEPAFMALEIVKRSGGGLRGGVGRARLVASDVAGATEAELETAVA